MMKSPFAKSGKIARSPFALFAYNFPQAKLTRYSMPQYPIGKEFSLDSELIFQFEKESFIPSYPACYFDEKYKNQLTLNHDVDINELLSIVIDLNKKISLAYKKMMENDELHILGNIQDLDVLLQYVQKKLTVLEWLWVCASMIDPKRAVAELESRVAEEVIKLTTRICNTIENYSLFKTSDLSKCSEIWSKMFYIFETFSRSKILTKIKKIEQGCTKSHGFLKKQMKSYQLSGIPFDLAYAQQLMGESLQSLLSEFSYDSSEKLDFFKKQLLGDTHYDFALVYFLGEKEELGLNQLEKSIQYFSSALDIILKYREVDLYNLKLDWMNKKFLADDLMPGQPQFDELYARIDTLKSQLRKITKLLLELQDKNIPHLQPHLNRLSEMVIEQEKILEQKKQKIDQEKREITPELVRLSILALENKSKESSSAHRFESQKNKTNPTIKTIKGENAKRVQYTPLPPLLLSNPNPLPVSQIPAESCYAEPTLRISEVEIESAKTKKLEKYLQEQKLTAVDNVPVQEVKQESVTLFFPILQNDITVSLDIAACLEEKLSDDEIKKLQDVLKNGKTVGAKGQGIKFVYRDEKEHLKLGEGLWIKLKPLGKNGLGDLRVYGKINRNENGELNVSFNVVNPRAHKTLERGCSIAPRRGI